MLKTPNPSHTPAKPNVGGNARSAHKQPTVAMAVLMESCKRERNEVWLSVFFHGLEITFSTYLHKVPTADHDTFTNKYHPIHDLENTGQYAR